MSDAIIFMPVGTSCMTNFGISLQLVQQMGKQAVGFIKEKNRKSRGLKATFANWNPDEKAKPSAEVCSLYAFWEKKWANESRCKNVKIVLLHSPGIPGETCAQAIQELIKAPVYFTTGNIEWDVTTHELDGLDPQNPHRFSQCLTTLARIITETISEFMGEIYINISGGYKALTPYLTMMAMASDRKIEVFYLHENSPEIIVLPMYPLAFDMSEWRDWRGMLLPFTHPQLLSHNQQEFFYDALSNTKVAGLLKEEGVPTADGPRKISLNSVGSILQKNYSSRRTVLSEFGQGHLLLDEFEDSKYADYLKNKCIPRWQHLAVGDHIPETVEHGRGHVQRLLELGQQLLTASDIRLTDEQRFVLICSIWLHDLGHSGNDFTFRGPDGLVQKFKEKASTASFFVYGSPDQVRKYHNFLSWELLEKEKNFIFPSIDNLDAKEETLRILLNSIALCCLYHRRSMPVLKEKAPKQVNECWVTKSIEDFKEGSEVISGFSLVTALLRVLDGAENQQERSGSNESYAVTKWVLRRQVESMERDLEKTKDNRLFDEMRFKRGQPEHFDKHRLIRNVLFVSPTDNVSEEYIYGSEKLRDKAPRTDLYLIAGDTVEIQAYDNTLKQELIAPLLDEFLLVEKHLPFKLALVFVPDITKPESKQQICIRYKDPTGNRIPTISDWTITFQDL